MKQTFNRRFLKNIITGLIIILIKRYLYTVQVFYLMVKMRKGDIYFLLGKDKQLSWSDFGGRD